MSSMRNRLCLLVALALFPLFTACAGSGSGVRDEMLTECACGKAENDIMGCTAKCAVSHECENPLCTCVHDDPIKKKGQ